MLSDCQRCWNTPCTCGWSYRHENLTWLKKLHKTIGQVIAYRTQHPQDCNFSNWGDLLTEDDISLLKATGSWIDP